MNDASNVSLFNRLRHGGLALALICLGALLLRWAHLWLVSGSDFVRLPIIDAGFYHRWAVEISRGAVKGDSIFFMSPLYPYLMGLVYAVLGAAPWKMMLMQGLLGTATVALVFAIADRLTDRRTGLVAAGVAAIYAPSLFFDATLLTSGLILFLSASIFYLSLSALESGRARDLWLLGIMLGLSALARPLVLLFYPALALLFAFNNRPTALRNSLLVAAGILVLLIPVGVRNLIIGGEFTLTTASAGMNLYVGNNPDATGLYWEAPFLTSVEPEYEDLDYRMAASEARGRHLTTAEAGGFWMDRALDWIIHEPFDWVKLEARKFVYFWNRVEFANNVSIYLGKALSPLIRFNPIGFWLIAPLGLAGLIRLWKRFGWKRVQVPATWVLAYFLGGMIFFVSSEYRYPIVLALFIGAAFIALEIVERWKVRGAEPAMSLIVLGLLFFPLVNLRTEFIHSGENARMDWFNIGNTWLKLGEYPRAVESFERSLKVDPNFPEALLKLAEAHYRNGNPDAVVEIGKRADIEDPQVMLNLMQGLALKGAYDYLSEGKFRSAMQEFAYAGWNETQAAAETTRVSLLIDAQKAYQDKDPDHALEIYREINRTDSIPDPALMHNLGFIHLEQGRLDSAEYYALQALELDSTNAPAIYLTARIFNATGRQADAEKLMRRLDPERPQHEEMLNRIRAAMDSLTALGLWKPALEAYIPYGRLGYDMPPVDKLRVGRLQLEVGNVEQALQTLNEAESGGLKSATLYLHLGRAQIATGSVAEGIASLQKAAALDTDLVEARIALARVYMSRGKVRDAWREIESIAHLQIISPRVAQEYDSLVDSLKAM